MCGKGLRNGLKRISVLLLLFVLLGSPCFAAASWAAWFKNDVQEIPSVSMNQPSAEVEETTIQESSEIQSETLYEMSSVSNTDSLMKQIEELEKQLIDLEKESEMLKSYWSKSSAQLEALRQTDQISEVEYDTIKASLTTIVPENIKQADKIAKLEKEAGTKAYITLGGVIGFDNMSPQYGVTGSLGVKIGNSLMLEAGVEYMLGNLSDPFNINFTSFDLDDLRVTASIGWMF